MNIKLKEIKNIEEYKLCYVESGYAFFTRRNLSEQWGDDWDDAPYEHNAGYPYSKEEGDILQIPFVSNLVTPNYNLFNSPFSVEKINKGYVAWLRDEYGNTGTKIMAGCGIEEFCNKVIQTKGAVFMEIEIS